VHHPSHPGANPSETTLAELFRPPGEGYGSRGIDLTTDGVVCLGGSERHKTSP
jgi:hypothetical protein